MQNAVIFDIDGTLSVINEERQELIRKRSWDKFHRLSICSEVNEKVHSALIEHQNQGAVIVLLTGRPERWLDSTEHWLEKKDIYYDMLLMRTNGDRRKSNYSKKEHLDQLRETFNIIEAWDDRQQDIDLFKSYGIKAVKVEGQYGG